MNQKMVEEGKRLKMIRKMNGYTQQEVANYLGIDQGHLSNIELGKRSISMYKFEQLCYLYNCSEKYIEGESNEYEPPKIAFKGCKQKVNLELVAKMNEVIENLNLLRGGKKEKKFKYTLFYTNIEVLTQMLRDEWDIDNSSPINIIPTILEKIPNLTIMWMPLNEEVCGCCSKTEQDYIIILNSRHSKGKQNFTIAHELYHLFFEDSDEWSICSVNKTNDISENEANKFAFNLLVPQITLKKYIEKNKIKDWTLEELIKCEHYFRIDHESMVNGLKNYGINVDCDFINNNDLVYKTRTMGLDSSIFEKTNEYYSLGAYINLINESYEKEIISNGKKEELWITAFRMDIVYNLQ